MASTDTDKPQELEGVATIMRDLEDWLNGLKPTDFMMETKGDIGRCVASDRAAKLAPLFGALGIQTKIDSGELRGQVLRILNAARVYVKEGWADLIPVRIISGTPTASGYRLVVGQRIHITGGVDVSPALDLVVIR